MSLTSGSLSHAVSWTARIDREVTGMVANILDMSRKLN
jgi:hypothetical protein